MPRESPDEAVVADDVVSAVLAWYRLAGRDLPWRDGRASAWGVLVSEVMLQQTPVARVDPVWRDWMEQWPTPAHLAAASQADAVRAWGRLGYPRRAARLWECARVLVERHGGVVPTEPDALLALPGIGAYTAAAIVSFAHGGRSPVVDTNVKRVFARVWGGDALPASAGVSAAERALAARVLPAEPALAAEWAVASMELGALVCTARAPKCDACPIAAHCAWRAAGYPASGLVKRPNQPWHGTDRQVRGRIMAVLREATDAVPLTQLDGVPPEQFSRALASLLADGLVTEAAPGAFSL